MGEYYNNFDKNILQKQLGLSMSGLELFRIKHGQSAMDLTLVGLYLQESVLRLPQLLRAERKIYSLEENNKEALILAMGSLVLRCFSMYQFDHWGRKVFHISGGLMQRLSFTDIKELVVDDLKFPFPSIYISFSEGMQPIGFKGQSFLGCYISYIPWEINSTGDLIKDLNREPYDLLHVNYISYNEKNDLVSLDESIQIHRGHILSHCIEGYYQQYVNFARQRGLIDKSITDEEYIDREKAFINLIINIIVYINSRPDQVINRSNRSGKSHRKRIYQNEYNVGGKIKIDPNLPQVIYVGEARKKYAKSIFQWMVRGHWRNQPYGHERQERKLIWIEPYIKGNTIGDVIHKDYKVE